MKNVLTTRKFHTVRSQISPLLNIIGKRVVDSLRTICTQLSICPIESFLIVRGVLAAIHSHAFISADADGFGVDIIQDVVNLKNVSMNKYSG
jgi:hypothetical protein